MIPAILAGAGVGLILIPWLMDMWDSRPAPEPDGPLVPSGPDRVEVITDLLELRDWLADDAKAVEVIDRVIIPAVIARGERI